MTSYIIFSILAFGVFYAYFGYPLILAVLARGKKDERGAGADRADTGGDMTGTVGDGTDTIADVGVAGDIPEERGQAPGNTDASEGRADGEFERGGMEEIDGLPEVSILIAAYNEEDTIAKKIENSLELDYPTDKLHIVVVSDGSTDGTDGIVQSFDDSTVELFRVEGRKGKTVARNEAVKQAKGEIIVFTDANAFFHKDAVKALARHFEDESVGAVCGNLVLKKKNGEENLYWRYEKLVKRLEDRFHSIVGANGSIYAIRKELYTPLTSEVDDDFVEPLLVYTKGKRIVYEPLAVSEEEDIPHHGLAHEFEAKKRVVLRGLQSLSFAKQTLNPFRYPVLSFEIFSHKIMKWLVPFFLIFIFIDTFFMPRGLFSYTLFFLQLIFYGAALYGIASRSKLFHVPAYFVSTNAAILAAVTEFITGKRSRHWEKRRG